MGVALFIFLSVCSRESDFESGGRLLGFLVARTAFLTDRKFAACAATLAGCCWLSSRLAYHRRRRLVYLSQATATLARSSRVR